MLSYLPNTETIGEAINFYFIFVFSPPVRAVHPAGRSDTELFFPGGLADSRNQALIQFRNGLAAFINDYEPTTPSGSSGHATSRPSPAAAAFAYEHGLTDDA